MHGRDTTCSLKSFPVDGKLPEVRFRLRGVSGKVREDTLGLRFPASRRPPLPVVDCHLRDLEMTVLKLFDRCWVGNPRRDESAPGHVVVDGVGLSPSVLNDPELLNAIVHCASMIFRLHGTSIVVSEYGAKE